MSDDIKALVYLTVFLCILFGVTWPGLSRGSKRKPSREDSENQEDRNPKDGGCGQRCGKTYYHPD